jgi:hypothetical protein
MNRWLFDPLRLGGERPRAYDAELDEEDTLPIGRQIALYVTVVLGIFGSTFLESYQSGQPWKIDWLTMLIALIGGVVLLPGAVDRQKLNGHKEELVQFAVIFAYGMGWQMIVGSTIRAVLT